MKKEHEIILTKIKQYLETHPNIRFCQALFNLDINQFEKSEKLDDHPVLRDTYNDEDYQLINRIDESNKTLSKTIIDNSLYQFTIINKNGIRSISVIACSDWLHANRIKTEILKSKRVLKVEFEKIG